MQFVETGSLLLGRFLLGIYFIIPAIGKITGFEATLTYMETHNVPLTMPLLILTIILQLGCGAAIIVGFKGKLSAFILAGLTLVISLFMHNFWDFAEGMERAHETQNFFKNMGILAGLLMVTAIGVGPMSLDARMSKEQTASD